MTTTTPSPDKYVLRSEYERLGRYADELYAKHLKALLALTEIAEYDGSEGLGYETPRRMARVALTGSRETPAHQVLHGVEVSATTTGLF